MSLYKRKDCYYVDITTPTGSRIRRSTQTDVKKKAQEFHDRLKAELWDAEILKKEPDHIFEEALIMFLDDCKGRRGEAYKKIHATHFREYFAGRTLRSLTSEELVKSIPVINKNTGKTLSPATRNRYRSSIKRILSLAFKSGWIDQMPFLGKDQEPKVRVSWITKDDAEALIQNLSLEWMKNICSFALLTGARMGEILSMTWDKIDFDKKIAIVTSDKAKSGKARSLPLNREAIILLKVLRAKAEHKERVFVRTSTKAPINYIDRRDFKQAVISIGKPTLHFHDLRHTWASWHVQAGTPLFTLKEMGGWETLEMVKKYAHLNADHILDFANHVTFTTHAQNMSHLKIA